MPGNSRAGASNVPSSRTESTAMPIFSSATSIGFDHRIFGYRAHMFVDAAKVNRRAAWRHNVGMDFIRRCTYALERRVGLESEQCRDFGRARATETPGLFEYAAALHALLIAATDDIVVAAGCKELRKSPFDRCVITECVHKCRTRCLRHLRCP